MASWDKRPKEPQKAFAYFVVYRDLGPDRSLPRVSQISSVSVPRLKDLSQEYEWVSRADQWDAHLDVIARKAYVTELEKQARLRAQAHTALMAVAVKVLQRPDLAGKSKLSEAAAAVKIATEGMRVEAGLATAKIDVEDVTPLTDDERMRRLEALAAAAEARGGVALDDPGGTGGGRPAPRGVAVH